MTPERWQQVKGVLQKVLEMAPQQRAAFLDRACESDGSLRQEVESLLAAGDEGGSSFLQSPPIVHLGKGTRVGDYEIQSLLGAGGMGEVYRARDLRLRRDVAIKVIPSFDSSDPERLRRFAQEATAAAALNHPNILAVYQMGTHESAPYLVSELLEGETLREQIKRGRLAVRKAIDYAVQIARGLAAAHDKGIVHRDLKPENLFVTKDGRLKILDFGLAKLMQAQSSSEHSAPTLGGETEPGMVMGTVGYMAPEQVRGQAADHRADIFAFGTILYEMLSGKRAFQKPTSPETMAAILNEDPPGISQVMPNLPPALQRVVHRCFEKNPDQRFQSASDLAFALEALSNTGVVVPVVGRKRWKVLVPAALVLVAAALVGTFYFRSRQTTHRVTERDTIVLADFDNRTGDPVFDDALNQALAIQLEQSPFLKILSDRKMSDTLKLMGRPPGEHITAEVAREICVRTGSKAILTGSISRLGSEYLVGLRATACVTGDKLSETQGEVPDKEAVLKTLSTMASEMRAKLGESMASVQKFDYQTETTTSSLDALKAYSIGKTMMATHGTNDAIPFFKRAIELDPQFAKGYSALGKMYENLGETDLSAENVTKAYSLRDRVSEGEKYDITSQYYLDATGDLEKATETFDAWIRAYPGDTVPLHNRANVYFFLGEYGRALEGYRASQNLDRDFAGSYIEIALACLALNRLQDAKSALDGLQQHGFEPEIGWGQSYDIAFLRGDTQAMARQLGIGLDRPDSKSDAMLEQARTEAYHGRLGKARELTRRAAGLQVDAGFREIAAGNHAGIALEDAECGNWEAAKQEATSALSRGPGRTAKARAALAFVEIGEAARAGPLVTELEKAYPFDTLLNRYWLPTIKAAIQIRQDKPNDAVSILEPALDYELAWAWEGALHPAYVRGQAYLSEQNGAAAIVEFQKILDHPGIVLNDPVGALAHLQLARAYALLKDKTKAKSTYEDFLALWKDADPDIPILKQAKAEYAKLKQ